MRYDESEDCVQRIRIQLSIAINFSFRHIEDITPEKITSGGSRIFQTGGGESQPARWGANLLFGQIFLEIAC